MRNLGVQYRFKHASWLNIAVIEISVLDRQCPDRHLPKMALVCSEVAAWEDQISEKRVTMDWHFTNSKSPPKLNTLPINIMMIEY